MNQEEIIYQDKKNGIEIGVYYCIDGDIDGYIQISTKVLKNPVGFAFWFDDYDKKLTITGHLYHFPTDSIQPYFYNLIRERIMDYVYKVQKEEENKP